MADPLTDSGAVSAALLRPLTSVETGYLDALIADVSGQLRNKLRTIDVRISAYRTDATDPTGIDPDAVKGMLARVIKRVLVNPKGLWSATGSDGPFAWSETYPGARAGGAAASTAGPVVSDDDVASILPAVNGGFAMPRTIRTRPHLPSPTRDCR